MGQGTESCGGYEVHFDPYDYDESDGFNVWTGRNHESYEVSKMSNSHIRNTIEICRRLSLTANFSCDAEKWDAWIDVFESELYNREKNGIVINNPKQKTTGQVKQKPVDSWEGKKENLSPNKTEPVKKGRGSKLTLKCWCGTVYEARIADLKRGWAMSCCKSCAAIKRDVGRKDPVCATTGKSVKNLLKK